MLENYYTVADAAEEMNLSVFQVYRRIHSGECRAKQHGRSYFIPKTEVERMVRETPLGGRYRQEGAGGRKPAITTLSA